MYMGWQCNLGQGKYFGHGPCSVNIMKQLYTNDYYCAKITLDDSEIYFRQYTWKCQDYQEYLFLLSFT